MNNGIHVSFSILVPQGICLGVGLLGHMVVLFLVFKEISSSVSLSENSQQSVLLALYKILGYLGGG